GIFDPILLAIGQYQFSSEWQVLGKNRTLRLELVTGHLEGDRELWLETEESARIDAGHAGIPVFRELPRDRAPVRPDGILRQLLFLPPAKAELESLRQLAGREARRDRSEERR